MGTVVRVLRWKGIQVAVYPDDWIVWAPSRNACMETAEGLFLPPVSGFSDQCQNVQARSSSGPSRAGPRLGSGFPSSLPSRFQKASNSVGAQDSIPVEGYGQMPACAGYGLPTVRCHYGPHPRGKSQDCQRGMAPQGNSGSAGRISVDPCPSPQTTPPVDEGQTLGEVDPSLPLPRPRLFIWTQQAVAGEVNFPPGQFGDVDAPLQPFHFNIREAMAVLLALQRL